MTLPIPAGPASLREGDELLVSNSIGRHGIAVLCSRENLELEPAPVSDCGPLSAACALLQQELKSDLRAMRDATRGGVSAVLHEWSQSCNLTLTLQEDQLPIAPEVRGACELLGLDPLYAANEGTMVVAVAAGCGALACEILRGLPECSQATVIGKVQSRLSAPVTIQRLLGMEQPVDEPQGAPLPRIC